MNFYVMTGARAYDDEFFNSALEERFYGVKTKEFDEFCLKSGCFWILESSRNQFEILHFWSKLLHSLGLQNTVKD
jgi:hypothetical protein